MGRAPFFGDNLVEHPHKPLIPDLHHLFMNITHPFQEDTIRLDGIPQPSAVCSRASKKQDDMGFIRAIGTFRRISVCSMIERSCSVYYGVEEPLPIIGTAYRIQGAERVVFDRGFEYDVLYVRSLSPDRFCTWCVRTDGVVLNAESLQVRGECTFERASTDELSKPCTNG